MPLCRLIGLALFITVILLAMAAAITQTTHLRVQLPSIGNATRPPYAGESVFLPPPNQPGQGSAQPPTMPTQYTSVPIVWPLILAASVGLVMWFMLPRETRRASSIAPRRRRR